MYNHFELYFELEFYPVTRSSSWGCDDTVCPGQVLRGNYVLRSSTECEHDPTPVRGNKSTCSYILMSQLNLSCKE